MKVNSIASFWNFDIWNQFINPNVIPDKKKNKREVAKMATDVMKRKAEEKLLCELVLPNHRKHNCSYLRRPAERTCGL